jgi:hypothetical protein
MDEATLQTRAIETRCPGSGRLASAKSTCNVNRCKSTVTLRPTMSRQDWRIWPIANHQSPPTGLPTSGTITSEVDPVSRGTRKGHLQTARGVAGHQRPARTDREWRRDRGVDHHDRPEAGVGGARGQAWRGAHRIRSTSMVGMTSSMTNSIDDCPENSTGNWAWATKWQMRQRSVESLPD